MMFCSRKHLLKISFLETCQKQGKLRFNMIIDYIVKIGLDAIKNKSMTIMQQQKIKDRIKGFIEQQNEINISCTVDEELDFEGLTNYIRSDLIEEVQVLLFETSKDRASAWETVMAKAEAYAQTQTNLSRDRVRKMTTTAVDILREFYRSEMSRESKFFSAEVIDSVNDATKQQLAKQTVEITDLIKRAIEESGGTFANVGRSDSQKGEDQKTCGCKAIETKIVFLIDESGKMVLDSPRYFVLLDWISRGSNDKFRITFEDKSMDVNLQVLEGLRKKATLGDGLSESEENQYAYIQGEIQQCENKLALLQKACSLFLNDKTMRLFCNFNSKKRILDFVSRLYNFNYEYDYSRRNSPDFVTIDFSVDRSNAKKYYCFSAPICVTALLNAGLGANLGFMDVCLLPIMALDKSTIEEIMIYYYLDLAAEIMYRDSSAEHDDAVLSLLNYCLGLH